MSFRLQFQHQNGSWDDSSIYKTHYMNKQEAENVAKAATKNDTTYRVVECGMPASRGVPEAVKDAIRNDAVQPPETESYTVKNGQGTRFFFGSKPPRPRVFLRPDFVPNLPPGPYTVIYDRDKEAIGKIIFDQDTWQYYFYPDRDRQFGQKCLEAIVAEVKKLNDTLVDKGCGE